MAWLRTRLLGLTVSDRGATAAEYCLLVGLIAGVIIGVVISFGQTVVGLFQSVNFP